MGVLNVQRCKRCLRIKRINEYTKKNNYQTECYH